MANMITRTDAQALIDEQISNEIIQEVTKKSFVLSAAKRLQNMTSDKTKLRVLDSLPVAGFVSGDTGLKPTSKVDWSNVYLTAEEIAVIIPIAENVLNDASYDIWGQIKPLVVEAFGKVIDGAILNGTNAPLSWGSGIIAAITSAGNVVPFNAQETLYTQIDKAMVLVEEDGFVPNAIVGGVGLRSGFRNMLDTSGQPIKGTEIDSINRYFVDNGAWDNTQAKLIAGDFSNLVYAIRQDITYKVLDQAVISDADGKVLYNLAQQDMVALRVVLRMGYAVPNPVTSLNSVAATRFPFALVKATADPVVDDDEGEGEGSEES